MDTGLEAKLKIKVDSSEVDSLSEKLDELEAKIESFRKALDELFETDNGKALAKVFSEIEKCNESCPNAEIIEKARKETKDILNNGKWI